MVDINAFGVEANADKVGGLAVAGVAGGVAVHAAVSALKRAQYKAEQTKSAAANKGETV